MSSHYAFRRNESLEEGFRRIAFDQLARAAVTLGDRTLPPARRVHELRKRFKETRALVRLFRSALGGEFGEQNRWYRDAGRRLAPYRDAAATVQALEDLPRTVRDAIGRPALRKLVEIGREQCQERYADSGPLAGALSELAESLASMGTSVSGLAVDAGAGGRKVEAGFAAGISAGRKAMREAFETGEETALHAWRKRVKDQWYQVMLFAPVWPELLAVREQALADLSHLLGTHHDLSLVRSVILAAELDVSEGRRIDKILASVQRKIVRKAHPIAERLYAARPRDASREVMRLWRLWRS